MAETPSDTGLPQAEWVRRAALRIRECDATVGLVDAADLASAVWRRTSYHAMQPEQAIDRLFTKEVPRTDWGTPTGQGEMT